jgi:FlaA1/EpsC-like NDP-sugar epimerase
MRLSAQYLRTRGAAFVHDLAMIPLAWLGAYTLRFNLQEIPGPFLKEALVALLILVPVQGAVFRFFGLYRGVWRFASIPDVVRIGQAVLTGSVISVVLLFAATRLHIVPRSVPALYGLLLMALLCGPRFLYRWFKDYRLHFEPGQRVLIVGAGHAGDLLVRDLIRDPEHRYYPVAFVDDDPKKWRKEVHGIRIHGASRLIPRLVQRLQIDLVMLALPSADGATMRRMVELCESAQAPFCTIPRLEDVVSGRVTLRELRRVAIEDILGREQVGLDWQAVRRPIAGRTILVTGAGGSIGSELCRQVCHLEPAALVLVENSEFNLYTVYTSLQERFPQLELHAHLADVVDAVAIARIMNRHRPEVVFHAAAYKHVPLLESQVREAVRNNILGTRVVAEAAAYYACAEFVLISTDKAVNPANVMGASKRVAELFCQNFDSRSVTRFVTVRFGNVLDSAGSVVPRFRQQIALGGPVTVTHPNMTRYFMTIREACQLILQAVGMGEGGEIFVLDMGQPVEIRFLAEQMIRLAGKVPGRDIEIVYTGLRPGEKLFEELFHEHEAVLDTAHEKISLAQHRKVNWLALGRALDEMADACEAGDDARLLRLVRRLVPEFKQPLALPAQGLAEGKVIPLPRLRETQPG